jgi:hypothetical protein
VPYPPLDVFRETGYLAFEQLASLRHRGAFSTVSYTFTTCCQLTQQLGQVYDDTEDSEELLREWYQVNRVNLPSQFLILMTIRALSPTSRLKHQPRAGQQESLHSLRPSWRRTQSPRHSRKSMRSWRVLERK